MEDEKNQIESDGKEKPNLTDSERIKILTEEFLKELNENPKYSSFFDQYNPDSVENFKEYFAGEKAKLIVNGKFYVDNLEFEEARFSRLAWEKLWEIQQRKLFDMQCRWRAKQIDIEEIQITNDFHYWSSMIDVCPFLPAITEEELARYIHFMEKYSYDDVFDDYFHSWQEYHDFKNQYFGREGEYWKEAPAWYEYYETETGLSSLYLLPDIRGDIENKYMNIAREKRDEKNKDKPEVPRDPRPYYHYYEDEELSKFTNQFGEYQFQYLRDCKYKWQDVFDDEDIHNAIGTLKLADRPIHFDGNIEWQKSIISASNNFIKQKVIEEMPEVFKSYLFRVQHGLAFENDRDEEEKDDQVGKFFKELVLEGRRILGEPLDFNY